MGEIVARKALGQHWLHDQMALGAMCDAGEVGKGDVVLEVGPGLGTLTSELVKRAERVVAVELDSLLVSQLRSKLRSDNLEIVEEDILKFDLTTLPAGYKVVANIPYFLTSHLLRVLCESANPPAQMALLVQKEVAERVAAKPGNMSLLSVSVQFYYQVSLGMVVPARLFTPSPKVDSQILIFKQRPKPLLTRQDSNNFFRLVKAGFSNRRKTLLNSLSAGLQLTKEQTANLITQANLNPQSRPQELSLKDWHALYLASKQYALY